jgi:very-short-patch-repair endonuclease
VLSTGCLIFIGVKKLICKICNALVLPKIMAIHLRAHHKIKFLDYVKNNLKDFEDLSWRKCTICGTPTRKVGDKHPPTCSRECMGKYRETLVGKDSPRFNTKHTDDTKFKIGSANSHTRPEFSGENHPTFNRPEIGKKISCTRIERKVAVGEKNPMYGKKHTPESLKKIFMYRPMNSFETKVAAELDRLGLKYTYQFFINDGERCRSYDFKLKHLPVIIESDGDYWHGNPNTTHHCSSVNAIQKNDRLKEQMAAARGYKVIRFWESDVKRDRSVIETKLRSEGILKG